MLSIPFQKEQSAAMCEHASPNPAMHVQCATTTVPSDLTASQGFADVADRFCEYLTLPKAKYEFGLGNLKTAAFTTHLSNNYMHPDFYTPSGTHLCIDLEIV